MAKIVVDSGGMSALRLAEVRGTGSAILLFAGVAIFAPRTLRVTRRELGYLAIFGICGLAFVHFFYFTAITHLDIGIALVIQYLAPVLVALWARFFVHEPVRRRLWYALALALAGLTLVAEVWSGGGTLDGVGVAAALAGAFAYALYILMAEHSVRGGRDVFSLLAAVERIGHFPDQLRRAAELAGRPDLADQVGGRVGQDQPRAATPARQEAPSAPARDYPPVAEIEALWGDCVRVDADPDASAHLAGRRIDAGQVARLAVAPAPDVLHAAVDAAEARAQALIEQLAGGRRPDALRAALEERDAELLLEARDVVSHRRLRAAEPARYGAEASALEHRDEGAYVVESHVPQFKRSRRENSSDLRISFVRGRRAETARPDVEFTEPRPSLS